MNKSENHVVDRIHNILTCQEDCEMKRRAYLEDMESLEREIALSHELLNTTLKRASELDAASSDTRKEVVEKQKYLTAVETLLVEERHKTEQLKESVQKLEKHQQEQEHLIRDMVEHCIQSQKASREQLCAIVGKCRCVELLYEQGKKV